MKAISRYIAIALSLLVLGVLVCYFSSIVTYVLIAWVLSMIGQPLMRFFRSRLRVGRFKIGRNTAAVLTLLTYFLVGILLLALFVPLILEQIRNLSTVDYTQVMATLEAPLNQLNNWLVDIGLIEYGQSPEAQISESFRKWFQPSQVSNFFGSLIGAAGQFLFTVFSVVFITFFFLKEQGLFVEFLVAIVPNEYDTSVRSAIESISHLLTRYFGGVLLQISIITIFVSVLLTLLGIKNALLIGFFAGLINVIPYLGPMMGAIFGILVTISSHVGMTFYPDLFMLLVYVSLVFAAMQLLDNFVLQPYIFSNSVLAHPLEIFIIVLMGAQVGGIKGMVLAIPTYTVLRVIAREFLSEFKIVQK
ncbi:MAG TPA: AI-2E family transporter, partial [Phaeodactylibacter sp.]|nr:AI-2E family transporter [Phaeodactylibacter sp.]